MKLLLFDIKQHRKTSKENYSLIILTEVNKRDSMPVFKLKVELPADVGNSYCDMCLNFDSPHPS